MQDRDDTPSAALRVAAYAGDVAGVQRLIAEGVDVNVWDRYGRNPLTFAAGEGHAEIVHQLLKAGAWIEPFDEGSMFMTPLMCAAENGRTEIAELLLDQGADPTRHGGVSSCTAEYYARGEHGYLAALLRLAEDRWRARRHD